MPHHRPVLSVTFKRFSATLRTEKLLCVDSHSSANVAICHILRIQLIWIYNLERGYIILNEVICVGSSMTFK